MTPRQRFDFRVNLMLPSLVRILTDDLGGRMLQNWKHVDPETLEALRQLDKAINKLDEVTEKHLEGLENEKL